MKRQMIAYYNEMQYRICLLGEGEEYELYKAGNSILDSQAYVDANEGVGKERMKEFATTSGKEFAEANSVDFAGTQYEEME